MKFQLYSDIHLELLSKGYTNIPVLADYLILAGDIGVITMENFKEFIRYCASQWKEVLYVFGNHEFYGRDSMEVIIQKTKEFFNQFSNVQLLDNSSCEIEGITVYGFVGWTPPIFDSTSEASEYLNDYNKIRVGKKKMRVEDHQKLAEEGIEAFKAFLSTTTATNIVIVTHFPPINTGTSNPCYKGDLLNDYFAWRNMVKEEHIPSEKIKVWCSGHTHWSYDMTIDGIRYISNQIGYEDEGTLSNADGLFEISLVD
jgi:Icc-related predicted phosphoesterase